MSKNLKHLFDFQKFEGNSRLSSMIAETESRYGVGMSHNLELSDDELTLVSAAGNTDLMKDDKDFCLCAAAIRRRLLFFIARLYSR